MLKIVYQGVAGAYSHIAAQNIYPGQDYLPCETFEQAMDMVQKNLADVEKARKLWEERRPPAPAKPIYPKPITIQMFGSPQPDVGAELKAMETETPGWMKPPEDGPALARSMIDLAAQLLHQAQAMLKPGEVTA